LAITPRLIDRLKEDEDLRRLTVNSTRKNRAMSAKNTVKASACYRDANFAVISSSPPIRMD
jgi:hypothetical protein